MLLLKMIQFLLVCSCYFTKFYGYTCFFQNLIAASIFFMLLLGVITFSILRYIALSLKCLWHNFFIFLLDSTLRSDAKSENKSSRSDFPSPCFSHLKTWNLTCGWVKDRIKRETGNSWVVTCHREHIDNQTKQKWRIIGKILVNNREILVYFFVKPHFKHK